MSNQITWANKDMISKILVDTFGEKSFSVYGIDLPRIEAYLPTELPTIEVTDRTVDRLFRLQDGSYTLVDFESKYKRRNKVKYMHYIARTLDRYLKEKQAFRLRFLVIYTGDVRSAEAVYSTDCLTIQTEQVFLSHINGAVEYDRIERKMRRRKPLSDKDLMFLMILPLTCRGRNRKIQMLDHVITLAEKIRDEQQKVFVLAAICVANNKFITQKQSDRIEEVLRMTKVSRQIFDKWKADTLSYGNEQRAEGKEEGRNEGRKEGRVKGREEGKILGAIETMRDDGKDEQAIVSRLISKYGLSAKQAKRYLRMVMDRDSA